MILVLVSWSLKKLVGDEDNDDVPPNAEKLQDPTNAEISKILPML